MKKYENANHIIYLGDALEVLQSEIESNSVDLVFIDPPYNIGKNSLNLKIVGHRMKNM